MKTNILGLPSLTGFTPLKAMTEGQVLEYDFKEIGPRAIDKSGHFNGGILKPFWPVNAPRRSIPPNKIRFDGKDDYIEAPDSTSLDVKRLTLFAEVKPAVDYAGEQDHGFISKEEAYDIRWSNGELLVSIRDERENYHHARSTLELNQGEWYRIVGTYDGSTQRLFLNGEEIDSIPWTGSIIINDNPLYVGRRGGQFMHGSLKQAGVYNRALSKEEIGKL